MILVLLVAAFQPAMAAEEKSFSVVLWEEPEEELTFLYGVAGSKRLESLEVFQMERTEVLVVRAEGIHLHAEGEEGTREIAKVTLNPAFKSSLIVLVPKEDGVFETIVLEDNPESPPYGSYLFRNLSKIEIEGVLGDAKLKLPVDSGMLVAPKAKDKDSLGLELWHMPDGKKTFLQRNTLNYSSKKYLIIFLYAETSRSGKVKLKSKGLNILKGDK